MSSVPRNERPLVTRKLMGRCMPGAFQVPRYLFALQVSRTSCSLGVLPSIPLDGDLEVLSWKLLCALNNHPWVHSA